MQFILHTMSDVYIIQSFLNSGKNEVVSDPNTVLVYHIFPLKFGKTIIKGVYSMSDYALVSLTPFLSHLSLLSPLPPSPFLPLPPPFLPPSLTPFLSLPLPLCFYLSVSVSLWGIPPPFPSLPMLI